MLETRDAKGATPLYVAADRGHSTAVECLLQHGAAGGIEAAKASGMSPAIRAAFQGHLEVLKVHLR